MRSWVGVGPGSMSRTVRCRFCLSFSGQLLILGGDQELATVQVFQDQVPVEVGLGHEQYRVGRQLLDELSRRPEGARSFDWRAACGLVGSQV